MDELGHILREARDTKGLTLSEVQEQTRISQRYLEALEVGDYDLLPSPVHVRGFLRNYARFLNLDPEPLLERYEFGQSQRPRKKQPPQITNPVEPVAPPVSTLPQEQIFFDPVNMEVDAGYQRSSGPIQLCGC
jgi:cytoskeletal protein RodZ